MTTSTITTSKTKKEKITFAKIIKKTLMFLGVFAFWIGVWQLVYMKVGMDVVIPSPLGTGKRILELVITADFWEITGSTVLRILMGYLCGILLGLVLSVATYASKVLYALLRPVISIARATPVASLTVIIIVWVTNQQVPLFIVGLMVFPIIWGNTLEGIKNTDKKLLEMSRSFSVSPFSRLAHIYVPSVYPFFVAGASTSLGLAWKSGIAAEILGSTQGSVGQQLNNAKVYLDSEGKFAWTVVVIILSIIFERAVVWALKKSTLHIPVKAKPCVQERKTFSGRVSAEKVSKAYGEKQVLDNVSLDINSGDVVAVRGASGTGKTTLLMILAGLLGADSGKVKREGGVNFLFQEDRLLPWLTVRENILFVNACADTQKLLALVSLEGTQDMYPDQLSGGMKRRLAIARTLAGRGEVVFLDEPFTGLDEELREETANRVFEYLQGTAVALVTHDSDEAEKFANKSIYIN